MFHEVYNKKQTHAFFSGTKGYELFWNSLNMTIKTAKFDYYDNTININ